MPSTYPRPHSRRTALTRPVAVGLVLACAACPCPDPTIPTDEGFPVGVSSPIEPEAESLEAGSCGGAETPEQRWRFTADEPGAYVFGTGFLGGPVYLLDGSCSAGSFDELACEEADTPVDPPLAMVELAAGDSITAVAEAADSTASETELWVWREDLSCPAAEATEVPAVFHGQTMFAVDSSPGCGGDDGRADRSYRFVAPADGTYRFRLESEPIAIISGLPATTMSLAPGCGAEPFGCQNDFFDDIDPFLHTMAEGEEVVVTVESAILPARFRLEIEAWQAASPLSAEDDPLGSLTLVRPESETDSSALEAEPPGPPRLPPIPIPGEPPDCVAEDLGSINAPFSLEDSTTGALDVAVAGTGEPACLPYAGVAAADVRYRWTAPQDGTYRFEVTTDAFSPLIYVEEDAALCGGSTLGCDPSYVEINIVAGQTVIIVVDGRWPTQQGDFVLDITSV